MKPAPTYHKQTLILRLTLVCWLIMKSISWKVWMTDHLFPLTPSLSLLSAVPAWVHTLLFIGSLSAMVLVLFKPDHKQLLWILLGIEFSSCILDQGRWQPWEYQFLFTVFIYAVNIRRRELILPALLFMMAASYFYSGLQKVNPGFLYVVWESVILRVLVSSHTGPWPQWVSNIGYLLAIMELLAGITLLSTRYRPMAAVFLIAMQLLNLYLLGPLGLNYNRVVWPWDIMMALFLVIFVFYQREDQPALKLGDLWAGGNTLLLICWGILPMLNLFGLWDNYLSLNLYSGRLPIVTICVKDDASLKELQPYISHEDAYHICGGKAQINIQLWAMDEMGVPPYPEMRVYQQVQRAFTARYPAAEAQMLYNAFPYNRADWKEIR